MRRVERYLRTRIANFVVGAGAARNRRIRARDAIALAAPPGDRYRGKLKVLPYALTFIRARARARKARTAAVKRDDERRSAPSRNRRIRNENNEKRSPRDECPGAQ